MIGRSRGVVAAALLAAAALLTSCQTPQRLGVPTTVVAVTGRCDTSAVVEIGASLPLSGASAAQGRAELAGLEVGVAQVNRAGGVLASHRCLELLYKDDRSSPAVDNQALDDLVHLERVSLVVGPFLALNEPHGQAHLGTLGVSAATFSSDDQVDVPHGYPYTYPIGWSAGAQGGAVAAAVKSRHWRVVTVISSGSGSVREAVATFEADVRPLGVHLHLVHGAPNTAAAAAKILPAARASGTEALVVFGDGPTVTSVLSARRALHWSTPVIAATGPASPSLPGADVVGVDVVIPQTLRIGRSVPSALASFRTRILTLLHRTAIPGALTPYAQGADAVGLFANAANGVNADDPGSVRTFIENANYQGLLGAYNYTSSAHVGLDGSQLAVVPAASLIDGLYRQGALHR